MQPVVQGFFEPPCFLNVATGFSMFGGLLPDKGPTNQLQAADQISWSHGKHSIRAGYEFEWTNWPLEDPGLQQGLCSSWAKFVSQGHANNPRRPGSLECRMFVLREVTSGPTGGHSPLLPGQNQNAYVLDDWKVNSRLTINMGLRWEYDGLLSDKYGHLTQVWVDRMARMSRCGLHDPKPQCGLPVQPAVQQYVVPSNFISQVSGNRPTGVGIARNRHSVRDMLRIAILLRDWVCMAAAQRRQAGCARRGRHLLRPDWPGPGCTRFRAGLPLCGHVRFWGFSPRWFQFVTAAPFAPIALVCVPSDPGCNRPPAKSTMGLALRRR